jgi:hypothetical protein
MALLVRHLKQVTATLPCIQRTNKSCRIFINRISTDEALMENPDCKIQVQLLDDTTVQPKLDVIFRDNHQIQLETATMKPDEIYEVLSKYARKLQEKSDMSS